MKKERFDQADRLLEEYSREKGIDTLVGVNTDPHSGEYSTLSYSGLDRDSDTVKKLEEAGFKVVYPAELKEQEVDKMDDDKRAEYDIKLRTALIVDGKEETRSLDLANAISSHYFSTGHGLMGGVSAENNSITEFPQGQFVDGSSDKLNKLFTDLGYESQVTENGDITVKSDIPYPTVQKSKFRQLYDMGKEKISSSFAKLKSFFKAKEKDNGDRDDSDDRV